MKTSARATWILFRGLGREAGHWGPFLPVFRDAMPDAALLPLDLPGAGARLHERVPSTLAGIVDAVRGDALARVEPGSPLVLFGMSLGGMVVLDWAARYPEGVAGVAVAGSSAGNLSPFWKRMRPSGLVRLLASTVTTGAERRQGLIVRTVSNRRDLWPETIRAWADVDRQRPVTRRAIRDQTRAASLWRAPHELRVPSLFLVGDGDRLVHPDCSRALAARFGSELVEHPSAGHDLTTDATDWCVGELTRFGRSLGVAGQG